MFVFQPDTAGTVVALLGQAVARGPDGRLRMLAIGDRVAADEVVLAAQNGHVQLDNTAERDPLPRPPSAALSIARPKLVALAAPDPEPPVVLAQATAPSPSVSPRAADPGPWTAEPDAGGLLGALRFDRNALSGTASGFDTMLGGTAADALAGPVARGPSMRPLAGDRYAPQADAGSGSGAEDRAIPVSLTGRDPDGGIARVIVVKVPTGGLLYRPDGVPIQDRDALSPEDAHQMVFVPAPHFHGNPGPVQYLVEDRSGKWSPVVSVTLSVAEVNDAPVPGTTLTGPDLTPLPDAGAGHIAGTPDYRWTTAADTSVQARINATDVDGDPLAFGAAAPPAHGTLQLEADGRFTYTPESGWRGSDRFVVSVDDGRGGRAESAVTIEVGLPQAGPASDASPLAPSEALATPLEPLPAQPLSFDEIFGRAAVHTAAAQRVGPPATSAVEADVLLLSHLLIGHRPGPAWPVDGRALDLGLDPWGQPGAA